MISFDRCGKNYMASEPIVPPGGLFPIPATSSKPLIAFRCAPAIKPYIPEDVALPASFIIDTTITDKEVSGASAISLPTRGGLGSLAVTVSVNGKKLAIGNVPVNSTKFELPFSLAGLKPQAAPFQVSCSASYSAVKPQSIKAFAELSFLPTPPTGRSVTKMDLRTGAILAKPANGAPGPFETVFPIGFYTNFGGYIASNLSLLDDIKADGCVVLSLEFARH